MNPLWSDIAARANLTLSQAQLARLSQYLDVLLKANETMNLTRITDRDKAELLHVADSLTLLPFLPPGDFRAADIGSGGGVPGLPLAIARPDARFVLVESTKKKAAFLRQAAADLGLRNVVVLDERVEDVGRSGRREALDVVTARGVALLPWLIEWAVPLLRKGGVLLAQKGERAADEVGISELAYKRLNAAPPEVVPVDLPGTTSHAVVRVTKVGATHPTYPRQPNTARGKHV